jgi:hypothetical protein
VFARGASGWKKLATVPGEYGQLSPDGQRVVTVSRGGLLRLWTLPDGKQLWQASCRTFGLQGFTADGKYVLQDDQAEWRLYDVASGAAKLTFKPSLTAMRAVYGSGRVLIAERHQLGQPLFIVTYDVPTGREINRHELPAEATVTYTENTPFSAGQLAVVRKVESRRIPGDRRATVAVYIIDVFKAATSGPAKTIKVTSLSRVLVSPDGRVAAAVTFAGVHFYPLPGP